MSIVVSLRLTLMRAVTCLDKSPQGNDKSLQGNGGPRVVSPIVCEVHSAGLALRHRTGGYSIRPGLCRTSENSVNAKFAEFLFHALGCILRSSNSLRTARGKYVTDEARGQARTPAVH